MKEKQSKMETMVLKPSPNQQEDNYKFTRIQGANCRDFLVCVTYANSKTMVWCRKDLMRKG